jgi:tetratricopeptide (TPR) repeat protein
MNPAASTAAATTSVQARQALANGEVDKASSLLDAMPQAEAHLIRCRIKLMLERWDEAAGECEKAVKLDAQSSEAHLWLGRALGERASRASFISAYSLGKRVREEFEEAVRLDAQNADALTDLGEFYYDAPSVVGGGIDKAEKIADQLEKLDRGRGIELRARIEHQQKHEDAAEKEFKRAIANASHPAYQWVSLASFYRSRERWNEMDDAIQSSFKAEQRDPKSAPALYDAASLLLRTRRNPDLAVKLLTAYLAAAQKSEQAPAFVAHARLANLLEEKGDPAGAQHEREMAQALAHDYKPPVEHKH